jgi:hypothetical protein
MKKDINSREDGVTKDMVPDKIGERNFRFPTLGGIIVSAKNFNEAFKKAKAQHDKK